MLNMRFKIKYLKLYYLLVEIKTIRVRDSRPLLERLN